MNNCRSPLTATVVVVTKNRRNELRRAVESAIQQHGDVEILVVDDGSEDGSSDLVRREFPQARVIRHEQSRGYIVRRNEAAHLASGEFVLSLDDDAAFSTRHVVQQTIEEFSAPSVGAVAIPYVDVRRGDHVRQRTPDPTTVYATDAYVGTAYAVRRNVFLRLGGYSDYFVHQGEESDFCIRMLAAGYVVRLGGADPIFHFESPRRDLTRMDYYGARNAVVFAWQNVPPPYLLPHLAATTFRCATLTFSPPRMVTRLRGLVAGYRYCFGMPRRPVRRSTYRLWRTLRKKGPKALAEIQGAPGFSSIATTWRHGSPSGSGA
jgi:glycosyltransferase involved in cell wall biosynthesis